MKRTFDILLAGVGAVLLSPLFALVAMWIQFDSGRPVLFRQLRVGRHGREFWLYKFRSMKVLAGSELGRFDAGASRRVTGVGRFLRRTKLDELPQLWNVLRGEMSIVGPRPEVRKWVEVYPERWRVVHQARPGITDPASIEFRHEEEVLAAAQDAEATYREVILPRKLDLYEAYLAKASVLEDIKIIWQTLIAVISPSR